MTEVDSEPLKRLRVHLKKSLFFPFTFWIKLEKVSQGKHWLKVRIRMTND